jgi:hypothetical protein
LEIGYKKEDDGRLNTQFVDLLMNVSITSLFILERASDLFGIDVLL